MIDGIAIIERVHKRGASVKAVDRDCLDLTKPINRVILAFLFNRTDSMDSPSMPNSSH